MKKSFLSSIIYIFLFTTNALALCDADTCEAETNFNIDNSIIKIHVNKNNYTWSFPWLAPTPSLVTGSGCIIDGNLILTNAHVVSDSNFIFVNKAGDSKKYLATVKNILHEADLALLSVEDDLFFKGTTPIEIGEMPKRGDEVTVRGFPMGGEQLSITQGIVSRIENNVYSHGYANLLTIQIDAAINHGNSGGPAIKDNKVVGVAFQGAHKSEGEGLGYIIPVTVIKHFLESQKKGISLNLPSLLISCQKLENDDLREKLNMPKGTSGVLVTHISPNSPLKDIIEMQDVITAIDGIDVANDGTISFDENTRTIMTTLITDHFIGDEVKIDIIRKGEAMSKSFSLDQKVFSEKLVPYFEYDTKPSYYILAGLVFQKANGNFLFSNEELFRKTPSLLRHYYLSEKKDETKELVILSSILSHKINMGYEDLKYSIIEKANGKTIGSIKDLIEAIESNKEKFHTINLEQDRLIVLDREKAEKANPSILLLNGIESDRSFDVSAKT